MSIEYNVLIVKDLGFFCKYFCLPLRLVNTDISIVIFPSFSLGVLVRVGLNFGVMGKGREFPFPN